MSETTASLVILDGSPLTLPEVEAVARRSVPVTIDAETRERVVRSRVTLEAALAGGDALYGVNTGFGSLARQRIEGRRSCATCSTISSCRTPRGSASRSGDDRFAPCCSSSPPRSAAASRACGRGRRTRRRAAERRRHAGRPRSARWARRATSRRWRTPRSCSSARAKRRIGGRRDERRARRSRRLGLAHRWIARGQRGPGADQRHAPHGRARRAALTATPSGCLRLRCARPRMSIDACRGTDAFLDERVHAARGQPGQIEVAARLRGAHRRAARSSRATCTTTRACRTRIRCAARRRCSAPRSTCCATRAASSSASSAR